MADAVDAAVVLVPFGREVDGAEREVVALALRTFEMLAIVPELLEAVRLVVKVPDVPVGIDKMPASVVEALLSKLCLRRFRARA